MEGTNFCIQGRACAPWTYCANNQQGQMKLLRVVTPMTPEKQQVRRKDMTQVLRKHVRQKKRHW